MVGECIIVWLGVLLWALASYAVFLAYEAGRED